MLALFAITLLAVAGIAAVRVLLAIAFLGQVLPFRVEENPRGGLGVALCRTVAGAESVT